MCGITGIIRLGQLIDRVEIEDVTSALYHRGPDGVNVWIAGNIALGHRRLSIIDLETGQQPMCNEDGEIWISYNGELYNYLELRAELIERGHQFITHSDTEVIIHAYEEWGDPCVERFRGMFAFGIVDRKKRRIFLARDHLGIKPLVWYQADGVFAFASEIQALRRIKRAKFDLDLQAIDQYLWLQYIPAPLTVYKQVKKLPPAHRMSITFDGVVTAPEEYWRIEFAPDQSKNEQEWLEELDAVLSDSVRAHLVSDVPFGAFLSGGVDSSAVVAYMTRILDRPVKTFSIGFEEEDYNELKYAEMAARRWGTEHYAEIVRPDALGILPELVRHYGEPFGDSSAVPTYYVCKLARSHVPMVLSGDGGDEAFAGYHSHLAWMRRCNPSAGWRRIAKTLLNQILPRRYPPNPKRVPDLEDWLTLIHYLPTRQRASLWRPEFDSALTNRLDPFEREFCRVSNYSSANQVQYMDLKTYLPYDILTKVDIASMISSLEVRTPFVDRRVVEFAATIPENFNIRRGTDGVWHGKLLLKKLMERYYPQELLYRHKMGFAVPLNKWFFSGDVAQGELVERLTGAGSSIIEYMDPGAIHSVLKNKMTGPVWLLLFLEEWLQASKRNH